MVPPMAEGGTLRGARWYLEARWWPTPQDFKELIGNIGLLSPRMREILDAQYVLDSWRVV